MIYDSQSASRPAETLPAPSWPGLSGQLSWHCVLTVEFEDPLGATLVAAPVAASAGRATTTAVPTHAVPTLSDWLNNPLVFVAPCVHGGIVLRAGGGPDDPQRHRLLRQNRVAPRPELPFEPRGALLGYRAGNLLLDFADLCDAVLRRGDALDVFRQAIIHDPLGAVMQRIRVGVLAHCHFERTNRR